MTPAATLTTTTAPLSASLHELTAQLCPEYYSSDPLATFWPAYVYAHGDHERPVWEMLAEHHNLPFIRTLGDMPYIKAALNDSPETTIEEGVIWYQLHGEGTINRFVGLTFQPALADPSAPFTLPHAASGHLSDGSRAPAQMHLTTPTLWQRVLSLVYPFLTRHSMAGARYLATNTTHHDLPNWDNLTSLLRRSVLRLETGIESGVPLETIIVQEAFRQAPVEWMRSQHLLPFRIHDGVLHVFTTNIEHPSLRALENATRLPIKPVYMEPEDEAAFWANWDASQEPPPE